MDKQDLGITSTKVMVGVVKSFFNDNDLPLGLVPQSMGRIIYHNRDITKEETVQIMAGPRSEKLSLQSWHKAGFDRIQ